MFVYKHTETIEYLKVSLLSKNTNFTKIPEFLALTIQNFQGTVSLWTRT